MLDDEQGKDVVSSALAAHLKVRSARRELRYAPGLEQHPDAQTIRDVEAVLGEADRTLLNLRSKWLANGDWGGTTPELYDVWISAEQGVPQAQGVDRETADFLVRALNCYDNHVGGEFYAYFTPAGQTSPRTMILSNGKTRTEESELVPW